MKNQSNRGRKKTRWFRLKFTVAGREDWLQLAVPDVARLAGVSEKTVYHWIAGSKNPSPQVMALLEIVAGGVMPWHGWNRWRFDAVTGRLLAPNRHSFSPADLEWFALEKDRVAALEQERAALVIRLADLEARLSEYETRTPAPVVPLRLVGKT